MPPSKSSAPVVGFNHNVSYKGKVFHIQTEDSGLPHAHYITHLFVGGNILASKKTSYAEQADAADVTKAVRSLMETQHKDMLRKLVAGGYDAFLDDSGGSYAPGVLAGGISGPALLVGGENAKGGMSRAPGAPAAPPPVARAPAPPPPPPARAPAPPPPPPARAPAPPAPLQAKPAIPRPAAPSLPTPAPFFAPPGANTPRPTQGGVRPVAPAPPRPPVVAPVAPARPPTLPTQRPVAPAPLVARPPTAPFFRPAAQAPQRPPVMVPRATVPPPAPAMPALPPEVLAARTMTEVPKIVDTSGGSVFFGEDLISDKSLDEVILSYLAADFEDPK